MPKSDTWPGGAALDPAVNMDSAGSCDSVISVNSACSDDSMHHLSAEERACLIYLEEMIESVEVQEDSGLSNDEPEPPARTRGDRSHAKGAVKASPILSRPAVAPSPAPEIIVVDSPHGAGERLSSGVIDLTLIPPPSDFMDVPMTSLLPESDRPGEALAGSVERLLQRVVERGMHEQEEGPPEPSDLPPPPAHHTEPRSPPVVAPKPKKLPANIILKSHRSSTSDVSLNYSPPPGSDRHMFDPQKVHMEALRKLGLLKSEEIEPGPLQSPKLPPQTRQSWAAPSSPVPLRPPQITLQAPPPTSSSPSNILPAPAAFCDPDPEVPLPALTPPTPVKSATLERSSPGLSSIKELSPVNLRNSRPRPASLGSKKEFLDVQRPDPSKLSVKETDMRRSLPTQGKLPRSQGISVLISPRAENEGARREALRKLGLLRD